MNARGIIVQGLLGDLLNPAGDLAAPLGQDEVQFALADDFTHHTLGDLAQGARRREHVKQIIGGAADAPLHGDFDIHDILVLGQHQRLVGNGTDLADIDLVNGLDRARQAEAEARFQRADVLAEPEHDPAFLLVDQVGHVVGQPADQQDKAEQGGKH